MSESTDEERLAAFMRIVERIPPTWTCLKCGREFDNGPSGEPPVGGQFGKRQRDDGRWELYRVGDLCGHCMAAKAPP